MGEAKCENSPEAACLPNENQAVEDTEDIAGVNSDPEVSDDEVKEVLTAKPGDNNFTSVHEVHKRKLKARNEEVSDDEIVPLEELKLGDNHNTIPPTHRHLAAKNDSPMDDDEDDKDFLVHYGKPLPPLEDDEVVNRKPVPVHEQTVKDEKGKQRFHGAFTGGFSAGYFNTVGSESGFQPKTFTSSRDLRADSSSTASYSLDDILDDEDRSEFGIAPKRMRVTGDFRAAKDSLQEDILQRHLMPNPVDLGIRLLRRLGVRDGKGVGALIERELEELDTETIEIKKYTCARPPPEFDLAGESGELDSDIVKKFKLAPDDVSQFFAKAKTDRKGLGYSGLDASHFVSKYTTQSDSKIGIRGMAFGVGALEEEDDDIYAQDSLRDYDFELGPSRPKEKRQAHIIGVGISEGFVKSSKKFAHDKVFKPPKLPEKYTPKPSITVLSNLDKDSKSVIELDAPLVFYGRPSANGGSTQQHTPQISEPKRSVVEAAFGAAPNSSGAPDSPMGEQVQNNGLPLEWNFASGIKAATVNSRFVSAGDLDTLASRVNCEPMPETSREMAAREGMFGKLTRTVETFIPGPMVCRRFNVKMSGLNEEAFRKPKRPTNEAKSRFLEHLNELSNNTTPTPRSSVDVNSATAIMPSDFDEGSSQSSSIKVVSNTLTAPTSAGKSKTESEVGDSNKENEEVLDSVKNFDLLLDVFGDEDDDDDDDELEKLNPEIKDSEQIEPNQLDKFFQLNAKQKLQDSSKDNEVQVNILERVSKEVSRDAGPSAEESAMNDRQESDGSDSEFGPALPPQMLAPILLSSEEDSGKESHRRKSDKKKSKKKKRKHHKKRSRSR